MEKIKIDVVVPSSVISFGKHKGKTFEWILYNNPQYILWLQKNAIQNIAFDGNVIFEAYQRMITIREFEFEMMENSESIY